MKHRSSCRVSRVLPVAIAVVAASHVHAAEPGVAVGNLTYVAPESCPPVSMLVSQVRGANARAELGTGLTGAAFDIIVEVGRSKTENQAKVTIEGPHIPRSVETLTRPTCGEVVYAVAQIVAKRMEQGPGSAASPAAPSTSAQPSSSLPTGTRTGPSSAPSTGASVSPPGSQRATPAMPALAAPQHTPPPPPAAAARSVEPRGRAARSRPEGRSAESFIGLDALLSTVGASGVAVGGGFYIGHAYDGTYAPSWRVGFRGATSNINVPVAEDITGSISLSWLLIYASLSPLRYRTHTMDFVPGLLVEGGTLFSSPSAEITTQSVSGRGGWFAIGGDFRFDYWLTPEWSIGAEAGIAAPLVRNTIAFGNPSIDVYEPPGMLIRGAAGARLRFW